MRDLKLVCYTGLALLLVSWAAMAQTTTTLYQCPDLTREGQTAHLGSECPSWVWSAPRTDYLIASCGSATCTWNSNTRWRRVDSVTATSAISACTGTASGKNCSREAWMRKDVAFPVATPTPVDCLVSDWGACSVVDGKKRREVTRFPSNGGAACPILEDDCQLPAPQVVLSISANPILVGDSVTMAWTSTNASTCQINYEDGSAGSSELAGSRTLGPFTFAQIVELGVICRSFFGHYGAYVMLQVHAPPTKSPDCFPHLGDARKVRAADIETPGTKYDLKSVWFCQTPEGPRKMAWVTTYKEIARRAAMELAGIEYDEEEARAQCEETCEILPEGALKTELDEWAAQFTSEQLGVIDP
jgi:hypothetical protein